MRVCVLFRCRWGVNADSLHSWFQPVIGKVAGLDGATLRLRVEDETETLGMLRRGDVLGAVTSEHTPVAGCEASWLGTMRYYAMASPDLLVGPWEEMPMVLYSKQDPVLKSTLRGLGLELREMRGRRNFVPAIDAYNEAVRVGLGWGMIPEIQAEALLESDELVVLNNVHLDLELWWQRWRLDSEILDKLTEFVHEAAAELR